MIKVLYGGSLRPFKHVGHHPQFDHIRYPPPGYEFVSAGHSGLTIPLCVARAVSELVWNALGNGSTLSNLIKFIRSRSLAAQLSLPSDVSLVFLPSMPFILGQIPWVIEIEDTTTLFAPFPRIAGKRLDPRLFGSDGIYDSGFFPSIKALLQSRNCKGIISHVRSTAESVPVLFNDPSLSSKVFHIPLGIRQRFKRRASTDKDGITILFTNSWHQGSTSFYLRGGLDVLEAYSILSSRYRNLRLVLRTKLPQDLNHRYREIIEQCRVRVIDHFLSESEMEALFSSADIYVLPSARLHVVSVLQAMASDLAIVVADGWGMEEYISHGRNGLVVSGRYGITSWMDRNGMLRENYKPLFVADPTVTDGLVEALSSLIRDTETRMGLAQAAQRDVETRFSIERWNHDLGKSFDKALS